jgi:hypothetical protein
MSQDFNAEVFQFYRRYESGNRSCCFSLDLTRFVILLDNTGAIQCPGGCPVVFQVAESGGPLAVADLRTIWMHVSDMHPDLFRSVHGELSTRTVKTNESKVSIELFFLYD